MTSPQAPCGGSCGRPRGCPTIWSKAKPGVLRVRRLLDTDHQDKAQEKQPQMQSAV